MAKMVYALNFESKASKYADSYHVGLNIPFNILPLNQVDEMQWKVTFIRTTFTGEARSQSINFKLNRNRTCFCMLNPH